MKQDVILVLDCGATNVRAIAVDRQGKIVARASTTNASDIAAENSAWHQWSLDAILQRFADCCRSLSSALSECVVRGIYEEVTYLILKEPKGGNDRKKWNLA